MPSASRRSRACWAASRSQGARATTRRKCWRTPVAAVAGAPRPEKKVRLRSPRKPAAAVRSALAGPHVQHEAVVDQLVVVLVRDLPLQALDLVVGELDDLARLDAHHVVEIGRVSCRERYKNTVRN